MADLIRTVRENDEIGNFSEDSEVEIEFQPTKSKKRNVATDFDSNFDFISSFSEYYEDTWDDVQKYFKRKGKNKTNDKISKSKEYIKLLISDSAADINGTGDESNDYSKFDQDLSDGDMKKDGIKERERLIGKRKKKASKTGTSNCISSWSADDFFEKAPPSATDNNCTFYQMNLSRPLMKGISVLNFIHPTPIQAAVIPAALLGRDICGCAATGTGKTAAYMLPVLERLLYKPKEYAAITRVLVLVPTRELGVQIYQVSKQLAQFTNIDIGLSVGGLEVKIQETVLKRNPDIVIATPGRLIDHLKNTPSFSLESLEVLVLDEADRMLDENFAEQMKEIIKSCCRTRQTLLFSATMTEAVNDLMTVCMTRPLKIFVDSNQNVAFNLRQEFVRLRVGGESERNVILAALTCRVFRSNVIVFVRTKREAHKVLIMLGLLGLKVCELHGNLTQSQRLEALNKFKSEEVDFLVATDVVARGLDISGVKTVINYVMPPTIEHYIHRVGRTARAGHAGISVSIATENDRKVLKEIIKQSKSAVKNRVIPVEIIQKYKEKLQLIETETQKILYEEKEEKMLNKAEAEIERNKRMLNKNTADYAKKMSPLSFDIQRQKKLRKNTCQEVTSTNISRQSNKNLTNKSQGIHNKLNYIALQRSKIIKRKQKPKRIKAMDDVNEFSGNRSSKYN